MTGGSGAPFWARRRPASGGRGLLARWRGPAGTAPGSGPRPARGVAGITRWVLLRVAAAVAAIVVMLLLAGFLLARQAGGPSAGWARSGGDDAVWVVPGPLPAGGGAAALAGRIRASGIGEVYVLAGRFGPRGNLAGPPAAAGGLLASLRAALPRVRVYAWLAGTAGGSQLDLDAAATRNAIVRSAADVLRAGFGGLQIDIAQVPDGDQGLLSLLGMLRELPALRSVPLSVTAPKLQPLPGLDVPAAVLAGHPVFWTSGYLTRVAGLASQVAVMIYNTGMPFPSWYSGYVARETSIALRAVPARTGLLFGVPAFAASNAGHHGSAETVAAAIRGIRVALTASGHPRPLLGVGLAAGGPSAGPSGLPGPSGPSGGGAGPAAGDWSAYESGWVRPLV